MSFMFEHWFEDEQESITRGEVKSLREENEKLKKRVDDLEKILKLMGVDAHKLWFLKD